MNLFGITQAGLYVQKEMNNLEYACTKEDIRSHVTNVTIIIENLVKESVRIYGYIFYGTQFPQELKRTLSVDVESKLMLGESIIVLNKYHMILKKPEHKTIFNSKFNRGYVYFTKDDPVYKKLLRVSALRGIILHDEQKKIANLEHYKQLAVECIKTSFEVLQQIKAKQLFPTLLRYHSTLELEDKTQIYFEDEIGSKVLFSGSNTMDIKEIKGGRWYHFKNAKTKFLVPVFSELLAWKEEEVSNSPASLSALDMGTKEVLAILEVESAESIRFYNLYEKVTSFGRSNDNDFAFNKQSISRKHFQIIIENGVPCLIDLKSMNGTYLNSTKIQSNTPIALSSGDNIVIGVGAERVLIKYTKYIADKKER